MKVYAIAALAALSILVGAPGANASYTSEALFAGSGFYCADDPAGAWGYGDFGGLSVLYNYSAGIPSGFYSLHFMPEFRMTLKPVWVSSGEAHELRVGPSGIACDADLLSWADLGCSWEDGEGIAIGDAAVEAVDPESFLGNHAWDLDGGGDDVTAEVAHTARSGYNYEASVRILRSLEWLGTQPIGSLVGGGLSAFFGGVPMESFGAGLNTMTADIGAWHSGAYRLRLTGSLTVTAAETPPVPEPGTLLLLGTGIVCLTIARRKRS
jgi:hypothetical protein